MQTKSLVPRGIQICTSRQGWDLTSRALLSEEGGRQRDGFYYVFM